MKKYITIILILVSLIISCATTVNENERLTSDDCLVVIKTVLANPDKVPAAREYQLTIEGLEAPVIIPRTSEGFVYFKIRNPGYKVTSITSSIKSDKARGEDSNQDVNIDLPYEYNSIVIAPFVVVQTYKKIKSNEFSSSIDIEKITYDEKRKLLTELEEDESLISWFE